MGEYVVERKERSKNIQRDEHTCDHSMIVIHTYIYIGYPKKMHPMHFNPE